MPCPHVATIGGAHDFRCSPAHRDQADGSGSKCGVSDVHPIGRNQRCSFPSTSRRKRDLGSGRKIGKPDVVCSVALGHENHLASISRKVRSGVRVLVVGQASRVAGALLGTPIHRKLPNVPVARVRRHEGESFLCAASSKSGAVLAYASGQSAGVAGRLACLGRDGKQPQVSRLSRWAVEDQVLPAESNPIVRPGVVCQDSSGYSAYSGPYDARIV